jgi:uncharacterized protein (DUF433 family)
MSMPPVIIDRGRGPEIAGTRLTVFDILDYVEAGWHPSAIATFFRLSTAEVEAAITYIETHQDEVTAESLRMQERSARGNPPEVQARLDAGYERLMARARQSEPHGNPGERHAGHPGGQ